MEAPCLTWQAGRAPSSDGSSFLTIAFLVCRYLKLQRKLEEERSAAAAAKAPGRDPNPPLAAMPQRRPG